MKTRLVFLLTLILAIPTMIACQDQLISNMDSIITEGGVDPLEGIPRIDFQDAIKQEQTSGAYLWLTSYVDRFHTLAQATDEDVIANITNGAVGEMDIATQGINPYVDIENFNWTLGTLFGEPDAPDYVPHIGANNIGELVSETEGLMYYTSYRYRTIYGLLSIVSDGQYSTDLKVGSDDSIKIWLNGEVVHRNAMARPTTGFQETIQVIINEGDNLLLVKVTDGGGHWAMFLGLEPTRLGESNEASDTDPISIDFGDLAKRPTIPEGADILEGEKIEHYASLEELKFGRIYDSAYLAANSEVMESLISRIKKWAIEACGAVESGIREKHKNVGYSVLSGFGFKTRQERETFKTALPGRWIIEADSTDDYRTLKDPKDLDAWWLIDESVAVIGEEEIYYLLKLKPNAYNPCLYVE